MADYAAKPTNSSVSGPMTDTSYVNGLGRRAAPRLPPKAARGPPVPEKHDVADNAAKPTNSGFSGPRTSTFYISGVGRRAAQNNAAGAGSDATFEDPTMNNMLQYDSRFTQISTPVPSSPKRPFNHTRVHLAAALGAAGGDTGHVNKAVTGNTLADRSIGTIDDTPSRESDEVALPLIQYSGILLLRRLRIRTMGLKDFSALDSRIDSFIASCLAK